MTEGCLYVIRTLKNKASKSGVLQHCHARTIMGSSKNLSVNSSEKNQCKG